MHIPKICLSLLLAVSMIAATGIPVYAADNEVTESGGQGNSNLTLEITDSGSGGTDPDEPPIDPPAILIATVPVELPIVMDLDGTVTVPTNAKIINNVEDKGIKVTGIAITMENGWQASDYSVNFDETSTDQQKIALSMRGDKLGTDGSFNITDNNWNIVKNGDLPLNIGAKLPKQTTVQKIKLATVGFTIDWSGDDTNNGGSDPDAGKEDPPADETFTVTYTTDGNGTVDTPSMEIKSGDPLIFPNTTPKDLRFELGNWSNTLDGAEVSSGTTVISDMTVQANFSTKAESPKNWFVASGNTITGLSSEYLNMVDAPTELVIPKTLGGSTITTIGDSALADKDLVTSIIIADSVTTISSNAFKNCSGLTGIYIPEGVKTISTGAFSGCTGISEIHLPSSLTTCNSPFSGWDLNQRIVLNDSAILTSSSEDMLNECTAELVYNGSGYKPFVYKLYESNDAMGKAGFVRFGSTTNPPTANITITSKAVVEGKDIVIPTAYAEGVTNYKIAKVQLSSNIPGINNKTLYVTSDVTLFDVNDEYSIKELKKLDSIVVNPNSTKLKVFDSRQLTSEFNGKYSLSALSEGSLTDQCEYTLDSSISAIYKYALAGTRIGILNVPKASTEITGAPWGAPSTCEIRFSDGVVINKKAP